MKHKLSLSIILILILIFLLLLTPPKDQETIPRSLEKTYISSWCFDHLGTSEVILNDLTRIDCVFSDRNDTYSIEVEKAPKFYEAIGQTLFYSMKTGYKPGIVLIIEDSKDLRYWNRLEETIQCHYLPIRIWRIDDYVGK